VTGLELLLAVGAFVIDGEEITGFGGLLDATETFIAGVTVGGVARVGGFG
jgi:hypothetical protein